MDFWTDLGDVLKFSFHWLNGGFWNFFLAILVANFLMNIIRLSQGSQSTPIPLGLLIMAFIYYLLLIKVLRLKGYTQLREDAPGNFWKAILVRALVVGASLVSWFEKKFLPLFLLGVLLAAVGYWIGITVLLFIGLIVLAAYAVVVIRNYVRLYPALGLFLQGKRVFDSLQLAWKSTPGKAHKIIAFDAALLIVSWLLSLVSVVVLSASPTGASVVGSTAVGIGAVYSPLYYLIVAISALLSTVALMMSPFGYAAIYDWIYTGRVRAVPRTSTSAQVAAAPVPTSKERLGKLRGR